MADFPEKENLEQEQDEFSTVFSDPTAHKDVKQKDKKLWAKILAFSLALCLLVGGTVAVIKLIPVKEEDNNSSAAIDTIEVKKLETKNISAVSITNQNGKADLYSETKKGEDDSEETLWYTKQVDKALTNSLSIENVVSALTTITSTRKITEKTAEECGLNKPSVKATVTPKEGEAYIVALGAKSPDNSGYYLQLDNDSIYLVTEDVYTSLQFDLLDFADTTTIPGFDNGSETLSQFDRLIVKDKTYPQPVEIIYNKDEEISEYIPYLVSSPQKRLAQNTEGILALYQSGIAVSGAYAYDTTASSLKKVGLDNPDTVTTMYVGNKSLTYKFALQEDGDYAVVGENSKLIHRVSASTLEKAVGLKQTDYYLKSVFLTNIDDINMFTLKTEEKAYAFTVKANEDEESEEDFIITHNGKNLKSQNFQNFYMECAMLETNDFTQDNLTSDPQVSIILDLKEGGDYVIEFTKVSATRYQCKADGVVMGRVTSSSLNNLTRLVEKLSNGETIED